MVACNAGIFLGMRECKISVIIAAMLDLQNLRELGRGAGEGGLHCRVTLWLNNITEIFDNVGLVICSKTVQNLLWFVLPQG